MKIFFDESGTFTATSGWSVVCSLSIPHKETGPASRKIAYLAREWPRASNGELKGGSLTGQHLSALVDVLFAREAIFHATAIDMSAEDDAGLRSHKEGQCEAMTENLTSDHHPNFVKEVWALRRTLEKMPMQLYVQSALMTTLIATVTEQTTMYFAQRRPGELAQFEWIVDAKDSQRITTQEKWWRETLGALLESRGRREALHLVRGTDFNYNYFEKSYLTETLAWNPGGIETVITGYDIKKLISKQLSFVDSRSDILIQATDILASFLRRMLMGQIKDSAIACSLGRLQIRQRPSNLIWQSIQLATLSRDVQREKAPFGDLLQSMSLSGRTMLRPTKLQSKTMRDR